MRILTVHADFIEVEALSKAIKDAELLDSEGKKGKQKYEEVLVVFTAVEEGDEDVASVAQKLASETENVAKQLKAKNILLYPLVHLTSKPSAPRVARSVIEKAEGLLKHAGYTADHSPFGWYKSYTLRCKGHPLSELSRELKAEGDTGKQIGTGIGTEVGAGIGARIGTDGKEMEKEVISASLKQESVMKSHFHIFDLEGKLHEVDKFNYGKNAGLKTFATYETKKVRAYETEPPHIKIMKEHGLIDYEPGSDSGNFRFLPKGRLIKKILERAITDYCSNYGAMEVETPIMYDYEHPTLKNI